MTTTNTSGYSMGDIMSASEPIANLESAGQDNPSLLPVVAGTTQDVIKHLFDNEYKDIKLDHDDALRIAKSVHSLRRGGASGQRLICAAEDCDFNSACELYKTKLGPAISIKDPTTGQINVSQLTAAPKGKPCPLEEIIVQDSRTRYMLEFNDLADQGDHKVIEGYINDLCQIEMMAWRCSMVMAYDYANPLIQSPGAVTSDGRVIWKPEVNPILEVQERLQQRKTRILNDLVKTPREKYKKEHAVGVTGDDSLGRAQAARKAKLKQLRGESLPDELPIPQSVKDTSKI